MKPFWLILAFAAFLSSAPTVLGQPIEPAKGKSDVQTVVEGNNQFAFDLYGRLSKKEGNIIFSPYSISTALAMTYGGARGETEAKMAKVIHFTLTQDRLHPAFGTLAADLQKEDKERPYRLDIANSLWPAMGLVLKPAFQKLTQENYGAGLKQLDFSGATEESRQIINRWVEGKTKDKIKELLLPGDLTPLTSLVLTNAIYFKADWKSQFPKDGTQEAEFEVAPTKKVSVSMMHHRKQPFNYFEGNGFQWLELPYKGDRLSMVFLLPQQKGKLADLEETLTPAALQKGIEKLHPTPGKVSLPRFKMTLRLDLLKDLIEMGMSAGPFSAMTDGSLFITKVIHKAFIEVDEEGTEAAAATAVILGKAYIPPFEFLANHPFLFLIRDKQTNSILFLGRVTNPKASE